MRAPEPKAHECARTALVVDDQASARARMTTILTDAGWRVSTAGSAAEALEKARAERPSIIFLDIVMPDMDGYQTCRKLAVDPLTRSIPVVFVSTKCQRADQVWARMQGGKALIGKPFSDAQVLDALRFALR
ncbi:MAG: response regulator [Lautropia sp.]|nr:response regulator [Lautropia sp.]MCL4702953.1 response regulator [Burkholderiaceae bacterium]MCZ2415499.1 response regulator [Burkholderiales bacterium]MDL1908791.1 response regulator [Betaproteobacteria bacterium PRO1]MEB2336319.1 response regulator [Burkholderiales bacterium]